ncbi:hypothetical protein L7F22_061002 [Adiantum nelumboides]|nr:hypothetical protein [Adiantum nelumboides]
MDEVMVRFADGDGDVLLATAIVESGLDVPRPTPCWSGRPPGSGLAQLHQLRGRVGRGQRRGTVHLLSDPAAPPPAAALQRLRPWTLDRLGAGFAVSARDLDLRGAGDLVGEDQAGHAKLVGLGLYQHLLQLALTAAKGERAEDWSPEIELGSRGDRGVGRRGRGPVRRGPRAGARPVRPRAAARILLRAGRRPAPGRPAGRRGRSAAGPAAARDGRRGGRHPARGTGGVEAALPGFPPGARRWRPTSWSASAPPGSAPAERAAICGRSCAGASKPSQPVAQTTRTGVSHARDDRAGRDGDRGRAGEGRRTRHADVHRRGGFRRQPEGLLPDGRRLGRLHRHRPEEGQDVRVLRHEDRPDRPAVPPGGPLYGIEHSNDGLITFPGGIPIVDTDGEMSGAIGVSGSTVENDHTVAEAGAKAIGQTELPAHPWRT